MIKRSLLVCLVVMLAWHFALPRLTRAYYTAAPGQQRANYLRAQTFVHDTPPDASVIVGSSMSNRLDERKFDHAHAKLAFPGDGPFTGLEIIRGTGRRPPILWVETNVILRDANADLLADVLSGWRMKLRETSPVFREDGRPSKLGIGVLKAIVAKACKMGSRLAPAPAGRGGGLDTAVFEDIMKANREHHSKVPDPVDLAKRVERLAGYVDELSRAGCKVVLFEMPIDSSLENLAVPAAIRKALNHRFPAAGYHWLDLRRATPYQTTDGIHLVQEDADSVVRKMMEFEKGLE